MQKRIAHYSLNGREVVVEAFGFTRETMATLRHAEARRTRADILTMTDDELIAEYRDYRPRNKMTKPERAEEEGYNISLADALIARGYCPDTVKWG